MVRGWNVALAVSVASLVAVAFPKNAGAAGPEASDDAPAEAETKKKKKKKGKKVSAKADTDDAKPATVAPKGAGMKKRVGFGAIRTLSSVNGIFVNGYISDRITVGVATGVATFTHRETDDDGEFTRTRTVGRLGIGPEVFFYPVQGDRSSQVHADFGFGGRVMTYVGFLGRETDEQGNTLDTPLEIDIELPAKINLWVGRRVAIQPEFGIVFRIVPGSREADQNGEMDTNPGQGVAGQLGAENGPGFGFEIGDHSGFFMGVGLGYYFGKL